MFFKILTASLPIVFMVHDLEEILMIRKWMNKNKTRIYSLAGDNKLKQYLLEAVDISTNEFIAAVIIEFVILLSLTLAMLFKTDNFWIFNSYLAMVGAFFVHAFSHLIQSFVLKSYSPGVISTNLFVLPWCLVFYFHMLKSSIISFTHLILTAIIGTVILLPVILASLWLGKQFFKTKKRSLI